MVEQAYDRWAPIYDLVFGGVFSKGRQGRHPATNAIGGRVLEVGVGTGISLPQYAPQLRIFGTDISEAMLRKAKQRVAELRLKNVEGLAVMDAEKLEFPDNSFDVVMAQYVVTAVPNPEAALDEFARVLRPGGELIILTRVSADVGAAPLHRAAAAAGGAPARLPHRQFAWSRYAQWLAGAHGMELVERRAVPPLGHFSLVRFRKTEAASAAQLETHALPRTSRLANVTCHYDVVTQPSHRISDVPSVSAVALTRRERSRTSDGCERNAGMTIATIITAASTRACTSSARSASWSAMSCCSSIRSRPR